MMSAYRPIVFLAATLLLLASANSLCAQSTFAQTPHVTCQFEPLFAAPRWWDDTIQWIRGIGWDRGRLVQIWLFFMLVGLYIILRIKPRGEN